MIHADNSETESRDGTSALLSVHLLKDGKKRRLTFTLYTAGICI
jgi:hypothetical protein